MNLDLRAFYMLQPQAVDDIELPFNPPETGIPPIATGKYTRIAELV